MSAVTHGFAQRVVSVALVVRLAVILVALAGMVGERLTVPVLAATVTLSATSLVALVYPGALDFLVRHPLAMVADMLLTLAVVAVLGTESPFVLATFPTALIVGVLLERRAAVMTTVVLVAGYLLVARLEDGRDGGFMLEFGVPTLYVCLVAVGWAVRVAHEHQIAAAGEITLVRESAAAADERARLAREMHDSLGKTLHGIALAADALPLWVERDPAVAVVQARGLADGARQAAGEARRLLVRMRADQLDRPLAEVLADRCADWSDQHGIRCRFVSRGAVDLDTEARYELLAIVGEALENVARHAGASDVTVTLRGAPDGGVEFAVEDDGRGFVPSDDATSPRGHYGLTGMQERAREVGASLSIRSAPGAGTRVLVHHPAKERRDDEG